MPDPTTDPSPAADPTPAARAGGPPPAAARVLHVDDDEANRYAVSRSLRKAGFDVVEAATGRDALARARELPDVVILDVRLPDVNGFEVCRILKGDPATASLPVLHLSASYISGQDKAVGLDGGADAYLVRPVEPVELVATVNALLRQKRTEEALKRANASLAEANASLRASEARSRFLADLGEATRDQADPERVMAEVARRLGEHLGASRCAYADVEPDADRFTIRHDYTAQGVASSGGAYRLDAFGPRAAADMRGGRTLVVRDVDRELAPADGGDTFAAIGIKAIVCCPLIKAGRGRAGGAAGGGAAGRLVAMMAVHQAAPRDWSAAEVALVEEVVERSWAYVERARARRALAESEDRFTRLVREVTDYAILTLDADGVVTSFNPGAEAMFGWPAAEVIGRPAAVLFTPEDRAAGVPEQELAAAAADGRVPDVRWHVRRGGGRFFANGVCTALYDAAGNVAGYAKVARDETDRKLAEEADARLAAMVRSSRDAIFALDPDRRVRSWNPAAADIFGYSAEEMIGHPVARLAPPDRWGDQEALFARVAAGDPVVRREGVGLCKDGRRVDVEVTVSPVYDRDGRQVAVATVIRDIRDRKRAEAERQRLLDQERQARSEAEASARQAEASARQAEASAKEAEAANRLKDEFLATLSHELRTPLNAIVGWAGVLAALKRGDPDLTEGLNAIERNARVQAQLIEDLLDVSRIISGKLRLEVQRVDLAPVVEAALASVMPAARNKEIRLQPVLESAGATVWGDPARLQQVVWNLVANAIKFTPKQGRVQVTLARVNSHVEIVVADTGRGIAAEFLPHVFERFRQADATTTRMHGGLGLGLAIVKHLVEQHGGTVHVASGGEGQGATFTVKLPLAALDRPAGDDAVHPRGGGPGGSGGPGDPCPEPSLAGLRVLVVDDEPDARNLLKRFLEQCEVTPTLAASAAEALAAVEAAAAAGRPFDALVSDIGMPGEDGYELIRKVRALPPDAGGRTPAVALTAFARTEDRRRALLAGFQIHVPKPVDPAELLAVVAGVAGRT